MRLGLWSPTTFKKSIDPGTEHEVLDPDDVLAHLIRAFLFQFIASLQLVSSPPLTLLSNPVQSSDPQINILQTTSSRKGAKVRNE